MKNKISIFVLILFSCVFGYAQPDSARTMNAKPGTPGSLRPAVNLPSNQDPNINSNANAEQTINHQGVESNKVVHKKDQYMIPYSSGPNKPKVTNEFDINAKPVENADGSVANKPPNVSNPIHK